MELSLLLYALIIIVVAVLVGELVIKGIKVIFYSMVVMLVLVYVFGISLDQMIDMVWDAIMWVL